MEEAIRIPLVIAVPDKTIGVSQQVVETIDLYPTLTELCGLPPPPEVQGRSVAALIDNPDSPLNHTAYAVKHRRSLVGHSIRDERYMYVEYADGAIQLYDLLNDPHELENLAGDPAHIKAASQM
jgi:arylsulfatase A-like enzyme